MMSAVTLDVPVRTRSSPFARIAVVAVHIVLVIALAWWSWRKWPDPLIDFGRELYLPWQITRGKILYRDLASLFGPLSPYVNAFWFRLFGTSLTTLVVCNIGVLMATLAGIYRLLAISTDRSAAAGATIAVLLLCGFSQYIDVGNYNFVTPYAHDATHGIALSVAALVVLYEGLSRELRPAFLLSGLCFGGALLTKPEVGLALASAVAAGGCAALWVGADRRRFAIGAVLFVIGAAVLPATFLIYFHVGAGMSWTAALLSVATGWTTAFLPEVAQNEFYRQGAGLDNPAGNVLRMSGSYVAIGLFVAAGLFLAWTRPRKPVARLVHVAFQLGLLVAATFAIPSGRLGWALPLVTATVSISMTARILQAKRAGATATIYFPLLMWAVFASAMLAKIALNARIYHYGFVLALPALSVTAVQLLGLWPRVFAANEAARQRARLLFAASIVAAIIPALALSNRWYRTKTLAVGNDGDRFYASADPAMWQGSALTAALDWIDGHVPREATLTALPEGVMINYLTRRDSPTRYINFMPPEALIFGEHAMAVSLAARPPAFLLLVHKDTTEYGFAAFGSTPEYGGEILPWVRRNYRTVEVIGRSPAAADGFGIEILERAEVRRD
jgi:hypothetical protein